MECRNLNHYDRGSDRGSRDLYGTGYENMDPGPYGSGYVSGGGYGRQLGGGWNPDYEKTALKEIRRCFSRIGLIYVAYMVLSNLCQWLGAVILIGTGLEERLGRNMYICLAMLSMYPLAVPVAALLMKLVPARSGVCWERWGIGKLAGFFVFSMGILYGGNLIGTVLMMVAGIIKGEPIANDMQELIMSLEPWTIMVVAVIIAPIMEELVFRKFLLDRIAGFGHWTAMMVSGVIFGVAHGNFYQFFYAFGLGVVFAYIYLHTGKIGYTISFHMLINFCGSILPIGLLSLMKKHVLLAGILAMGNMMLMFGFVICAIVLFAVCRKELTFMPHQDMLPKKKRRRAVWLNAGMAVFFLCGAVLFYMSL